MATDENAKQPTDIRIDTQADAFETAWKSGTSPDLSEFVAGLPERDRPQVVEELVQLDRYYRGEHDCSLTQDEYEQLLPGDLEAIAAAFAGADSGNKPGDSLASRVEATILENSKTPPDAPPLSSDESKTRIRYFGDYELVDEIARGGMGVVYRARQISLDRTVALKMILGADFASDEAKQRFQMEAESAGRLDHPHIVPIYDIGEHERLPYFSMKFVDGATLSSIADKLHQDHERAIELVTKIADAVHHAHQRGIVHRDLKPGNVLLDAAGEPLLTDFGLARRSSESELTRTGTILGTPEYMPPEQARGEAATTASDIYSLGAILYRLLTGRTPHTGDSAMAIMQSIGSGNITKPRTLNLNIHRDLEAIVLKCLATDPNERYASAADLAQDLRAFRDGRALIARPAGPVELIRIWMRQQFGNVRWVPAIALVVGGVSGVLTWWVGTTVNMEIDPALVEQIRPGDRAPLWWLDLPIPPVVALMTVLSLIVTLGMMVKLIIQPKTRMADAIAGFGVGLLAGIVWYIAGGGALLVAYATQTEDMNLLSLANQSTDYAEQLTSRRYPELFGMPRSHQVRVLETRIMSHNRTVPLLVGWIGAPLAALAFAVAGMLQTIVFGDIIRRELARRKLLEDTRVAPGPSGRFPISHYLNGGFFEYTFFAMLLGQLLFVVTALSSQLILTGATSVVDWNNEAVAATLVLAGLIAVATHWPAWLRVPALIVGCVAGGWLSGRIDHDVSHRWQLAVKRGNVARYAREAATYTDPLTQLRSAEAQRQLGSRMRQSHTDRAVSWFRSSIGIAQSIEPDEKLNSMRRQTLDNARFELAVALLLRDQVPDAAETLLPLRPQTADVSAGQTNSFMITVGNVLRLAVLSLPDDVDDRFDWTRRTAKRLAPRLWPDPQQASLFVSWIASQQTWHLYGPVETPPGTPRTNKTISDLLASTPQLQQTLVELRSGDDFPEASFIAEVAPDQPVWLKDYFHPQEFVAAYAVSKIDSESDQIVTFRLGSDDGVVMWIDGEEVHRNDVNRGISRADDRFDVDLAAGPHVIVLKISQGREGWGFMIDACQQADPDDDWDGLPVPLWSNDDE